MKKRILIIDDDREFVLIVTTLLTQKNHTVFSAHTIEEGIAKIEEKHPDFIFLDNQFPDGQGWAHAQYILNKYPGIQLNLISALDVPKTSSSSFRILEKQQLLEEIKNSF